MTNYICINGNKTELTDAQLVELGFISNKVIGNLTLQQVSEIVKSGKVREHFNIHDVINVGGHELEIIGFDHDKVVCDETLPTITLMAKTLLPARRMHNGACKRGWIDTELREWLNDEFINQLPSELIPHIHAVTKTTHNYDGEAFDTVDKLFLPSESELFGSAIWACREDGARYEAFATRQDRMRVDEDGEEDWYWTRSASGCNSTYFANVYGHGYANTNDASHTGIRAPLCFCFA